jgi:DNA (cytosine-5)-methyltransferase 1
MRGKRLLAEFSSRLKKCGYMITWSNVQMADYGIPQKRRRLVLLAGRGFSVDFPATTHGLNCGATTKRWLTLRDAIYGERAPDRLSEAAPKAAN